MDYWIDGKMGTYILIINYNHYVIFSLTCFFLPFFILCIIILLLEIDATKGLKSHIISMHRMIYKHLPGILILLIYYLYDFAWAEYHAGHYPISTVKEFRLFPSLDRHSNFIATIAIFCILYSGVFLWLNKVWFHQK